MNISANSNEEVTIVELAKGVLFSFKNKSKKSLKNSSTMAKEGFIEMGLLK